VLDALAQVGMPAMAILSSEIPELRDAPEQMLLSEEVMRFLLLAA